MLWSLLYTTDLCDIELSSVLRTDYAAPYADPLAVPPPTTHLSSITWEKIDGDADKFAAAHLSLENWSPLEACSKAWKGGATSLLKINTRSSRGSEDEDCSPMDGSAGDRANQRRPRRVVVDLYHTQIHVSSSAAYC